MVIVYRHNTWISTIPLWSRGYGSAAAGCVFLRAFVRFRVYFCVRFQDGAAAAAAIITTTCRHYKIIIKTIIIIITYIVLSPIVVRSA